MAVPSARSPSAPRRLASPLVQLVLLALAAFGANYARFSLSPLQESAQRALSLTDQQIALLQGVALALPLVIASVPLGMAINRYDRARLIQFFTLVSLAANLATCLAPGFVWLFFARCLVGLSGMAALMIALALVGDLFAPERRGRATMIIVFGSSGGVSAAFAAGGALLHALGDAPGDWRAALAWQSLPLALVLIAAGALRAPPRSRDPAARPDTRAALLGLWRLRALVLPLLAGNIMIGVADSAVLIWAAPMLIRGLGHAPSEVAGVMSLVVLLSGIASPFLGGFASDFAQRRGGPRRVMALLFVLALLSLPASLFAAAPGLASAGVLLTLFLTIGYAMNVIVTALAVVAVPDALRGLCLSLKLSTNLLFGLALAPLMVSLLAARLDGAETLGPALMTLCIATSLVGALAFAAGMRAPSLDRGAT